MITKSWASRIPSFQDLLKEESVTFKLMFSNQKPSLQRRGPSIKKEIETGERGGRGGGEQTEGKLLALNLNLQLTPNTRNMAPADLKYVPVKKGTKVD